MYDKLVSSDQLKQVVEKIKSGVDKDYDNLSSKIEKETTSREESESKIKEDLEAEVTRSSKKDTEHDLAFIALGKRLTEEKEALESEITDIRNEIIEQELPKVKEDIKSETTRATQAEQALSNQLNSLESDILEELEGFTIKKITPSAENVREAYGLYDASNNKRGVTINVYKDASLQDVSKVDDNTVRFTYDVITDEGSVVTKTFDLDFNSMIMESEIGDGLELQDKGIVAVKKDSTSESFLSISAEGVKISGIQEAIDTASKNTTKWLIIQRNGTDIGVYNGTEPTKINVVVPTSTKDLNNNAGFITSDALTNYVTLNGNQTLSNKRFSTQIVFVDTAPSTSGWSGNAANGLSFWRDKESDPDYNMYFGVMSASSNMDGEVTDRFMYMGWSKYPFNKPNCFAVNSSYILYKNQPILHSGNYSSILDGRYIKKSGDTITGALIIEKDLTIGSTVLTETMIKCMTDEDVDNMCKEIFG